MNRVIAGGEAASARVPRARGDEPADQRSRSPRTLGPAAQKAAIREVSEANNFPSRAAERPKAAKPVQRRRRTGRNVQFNIKATAETIARFTALADKRGVAFGELLDQLIETAETKT